LPVVAQETEFHYALFTSYTIIYRKKVRNWEIQS